MQYDPPDMQPWREKLRPYWEKAGHGPLRPTVEHALAAFAAEGRSPLRVADLGCGVGRDSLPLLALGHHVQAIDREEAALDRLRAACPPGDVERLVTIAGRFEEVGWDEVELTVSSFALPFCPPARFPGLWSTILARLAAGGRIACQLLGPGDDFAGRPGVTVHRQQEVEALLEAYRVELFVEEETDAITPGGRPKHWHLYHVVAQKR
jgi:tellurite methyltransferase